MFRWSRRVVLVSCGCALMSFASASASPTGEIRVGAVPELSAGARALGALAGPTHVRVAVTLQPRDPASLAAYATAVATPGSDVYRDYLSVGQFARRFGPTTEQIEAVQSALRSRGLDPGRVSDNGLAIGVSATAAQLAHAFSLSFERYALPSGRTAFASTAAPSLRAKVAGFVQGVVGLSTLAVAQPVELARARSHAPPRVSAPDVVTGGPQPCATAVDDAPGDDAYTADQIASAYRFSSLYGDGDEGAGQTVALYELEGNFPSDITAYQSCYGTSTKVIYEKAIDGGPSRPIARNGDGMETELDIENVIGLAPEASILVYRGPNSDTGAYDTYNAIIGQDAAKVISTSWGECESEEGSSDAQAESILFEEAATQGQTIVAAAGDQGAEDCGTDSLAVDDPASQPFVTGVGGTSLTALGPPPSETVWNDAGGAGGGGISTLWPMPSYQSGAPSSLDVINAESSGLPCGAASGDCRQVPDVSADGDPDTGYLIYWDGDGEATDASAWQGIGGTSGAAPLWAALIALSNASITCSGSLIGFLNPNLYTIAGSAYAGTFSDITSGNNDFTGAGGFAADLGYDMASGLGTPNGSTLAGALCDAATGVPYPLTPTPPSTPALPSTPATPTTPTTLTPTVTVTKPGNQTGTVGEAARLQIKAHASGSGTLTYSAVELPDGLSIDAATGLISGTPKRVGASTVTVTATGRNGGSGRATFRWTVGGRPSMSIASLAGVSHRNARLTFKVSAGHDAPSIKAVAVDLPSGLSFARNAASVAGPITVKGPGGTRLKFTSKLNHGALTISLGSPRTRVQVTITGGAIRVSAVLAAEAEKAGVKTLDVTVMATDASNHTSRLVLKLSV